MSEIRFNSNIVQSNNTGGDSPHSYNNWTHTNQLS
jgi:hypothetical protein